MKNLFRAIFVFLITIQTVKSQTKHVFSKSFETDKATIAYIEIPDGRVKFINSPDNNIYIEYNIDFIKLPKEEHQKIIDSTRIEAFKKDNNIVIKKFSNIKNIPSDLSHISMFSLDRLTYAKKDTTTEILRKFKSDITNEISVLKAYNSRYEEFVNRAYSDKPKRKERRLKKARKWQNNRNFKRDFIIKVPKDISLKIVGKGCLLDFSGKFKNKLSIRLDHGRIYINNLENEKNEIDINNSILVSDKISGGKLDLDQVFMGLITEIKDVEIKSEFSNIEIGELGKGNKITDFNSQYFFYNWAEDFNRFDLFSEYSKIHFFYPTINHSVEVIGYNTRNIVGKDAFEVTMQPKSKEKNRLMSKPSNSDEKSSGHIFFDIINGIIYSHNDNINSVNKD